MHRRSFLVRCSLAAAGATLPFGLCPAARSLAATVRPTGPVTVPLSASDRDLLRLLSAYSENVSLVGGGVYARAAGGSADGVTQVLAQVTDFSRLVAFLRSDAEKLLGVVRVVDNTLSFSFEGTAYTVTNQDATAPSVTITPESVRQAKGREEATLFTHEALRFQPATNTLSDPYAVLTKHRIDLAGTPTGGLRTRFQTVVHGWLESAQYGLKLGRKFTAFQDDLLGATPTAKAAKTVAQVLLQNLPALAASFDADALRPLLTSPLVSASLQGALGLSTDEVLAAVEKLRSELADGGYPDTALWLTTLLGTSLQDGSAGK